MKSVYRTFAGGEISPELVARADLPQNQSGLALCENFIVRANGTLVRRGGTEHLMTVGRGTFSDVLGAGIVPFTMPGGDSGGVVVGLPNTLSACPFFTYDGRFGYEQATTVSVTGTLLRVNFGALAAPVVGQFVFPEGPFNLAVVYARSVLLTIRSVAFVSGTTYDIGLELAGTLLTNAELNAYFPGGSFVYVHRGLGSASFNLSQTSITNARWSQENDVLVMTTPITSPSAILASFTNFPLVDATSAVAAHGTVVSPPATVTGTATVAAGTLIADRYYVSAVGPDGTSESVVTAAGATTSNQLETTGNYNTITWTAPGSGPTPAAYRIYYSPGDGAGRLYLGETAGLSFIHDKRTPIDNVRKPVTAVPADPGSARAVAHHEQRRWYAGATNAPQTVAASRINAATNFSYSFPLRADDGLLFRLNSNTRVQIKHLVPFIDLLAFTESSVFRIFSPTAGALSPSSLGAKPQGNVGAGEAQPAVTPNSVVFPQQTNDRIRELVYAYQGNGFATTDLSSAASHLFYNRYTVTVSYAQSPDAIVWVNNRFNGALGTNTIRARVLGLTYVPELELRAWHRHAFGGEANGDFPISTAVIRQENQDFLFVVMARYVSGTGASSVYDITIERAAQTNTTDDPYDGRHLDAYFYDERFVTPLTTIPRLFRFANKQVTMLLDGAVHTGTVGANGTLTLPTPALRVLVGLPYASRLQTLPSWGELAGSKKNNTSVRIRVVNTSYLKAGPSFDRMTEYTGRLVSTAYDNAQPLRTYEARMSIGPSWNDDGAVCVEQDLPLPMTVAGFAVDVAAGG